MAKRYGQLDRISGGRLILGVGVGSLREPEFDLLGAPFDDRGAARPTSAARVAHELGAPRTRVHGEYFDYSKGCGRPVAARNRPCRCGSVVGPAGRCDGRSSWPTGGRRSRSRSMTSRGCWRGRGRPEWARRDTPVDVVVSLTLDPLTRVDSARRELDAAERAGVTHVAAGFVADSRDHYEEQVAALVSLKR